MRGPWHCLSSRGCCGAADRAGSRLTHVAGRSGTARWAPWGVCGAAETMCWGL